MSFLRQVIRGLRALTNRSAADQEIADELQHYVDEATDAWGARGLSRARARRAARLEMGSLAATRDQIREHRWENRIETLIADVRIAIRRLRRRPAFAAATVVTLALGIGANTAIFTVIDGVLLQPLPYPHPEQLVVLRHTAPGINIADLNMAPSLYFTYKDEGRTFQDIALWARRTVTVTGAASPEDLGALLVTERFLPLLEAQPVLGRGFAAPDHDPGGVRTVILSDGYFQSRVAADPGVLGRRIVIDGHAHEVIGVLPASFTFMDTKPAFLLPVLLKRDEVRLVQFAYQGLGRLKPGVSVDRANDDVARMLPLAPLKFAPNPGFSAKMWHEARISPRLRLLKDDLLGDIGTTLWVLMGAVGIVLLMACANVATLLLVRADERQHDLAVRAALGAGWGRLTREMLVESVILSVAGGGLGMGLAFGTLGTLVASEFARLPRIETVSLGPRALIFTLAISVVAGLCLGLVPVLKYARPRVTSALRSGDRSFTQSREHHRTRSVLVVVQIALALVLLVGSGLMIRTFQALRHVDPGFSGSPELQVLRIVIPDTQVSAPARVVATQETILGKLAALPGVSSVAITDALPMEGDSNDPVYAEGHQYRENTFPPVRRYKIVSPGYVSTIGSRLIAGRDMSWPEAYNQTPVALVSENLARELWGAPRAAIGKRIRPRLGDDWREVIGVVADLHDDGVDREAPAIVYWPLLQRNFQARELGVARSVAFVVRTPRAGSAALVDALRQAVWSVNPNLPLANVTTMQVLYDRSLTRTSFTLALLAIAGGLALLLGIIGMYGVISYSVSQRSREIGIRLALGASPRCLTAGFVRLGLVLSSIGTACGLAAASVLTRLMEGLLFGVSPADLLTYGVVSAGLIGVAVLATYVPARRASRINPVSTLWAG
jgi:predicted permease